MADLPGAVEWHEGGDGDVMAVHFPGHLDLEDAVALAWAYLAEHEREVALRRGGPRHAYLRSVPWHREAEGEWGGWDGTMQYVLCGPGRGATPVTYVEWARAWDSKRCHEWPRCHETPVIGRPRSQFIDPPEGAEYVYLCRAHDLEFEGRLAEARRSLGLGIVRGEVA